MSTSISRRQFLSIAGSSALLAGLSLVGCGSSSTGSSDAGSTAAGSSSSSSSTTGKKYIIATDTTYAPFEFTDDNNKFVGIDVDLLAAAMKIADIDYDLQSLGFDAAVAALESGQADGVIAGMTITDERKKKYDFSDPYYDTYVCAAAKQGGDIKSLDDCRGKQVAAKTSTIAAQWAESLKDEYGFTITYFDTSDLMFQDVLTGNSAVCFEDYPVISYGTQHGSGLESVAVNKDEYSAPYGFAVLKGKNKELLDGFNKGLKKLKSNGEYDKICAKYVK